MPYQSDDLLAEVRRLGSLPSASVTGTDDADLLAYADAEMRTTLVPLMLGCREELYERIFDQTTTSGVAPYRVSKRAALSRLNTVQWVNADGSFYNLPRLEPKQVAEMSLLSTALGQPVYHYLEGSRVVLYPTPSLTGTLRIRAFVRPGRLALAAATGSKAITAVSGSASTTWVLTIASGHGWTTATPIDVVAGTPSFEYLALDTTPSAVTATSVEIAGSSFSTPPVIGDWVCAPDTSPFIQLPVELQPALVELTVARCLRAQGNLAEADAHTAAAQMETNIGIGALTPRVETADRKIVGGAAWRRRGYLRVF